MSFWDEIADKAKIGAQKVQEFTFDTVDKVKVKTKAAKLKNDLTKLYTEVGKLVYAERCGDAFADYGERISELLGNITALKEEIADLESQIEEN